jgi:hypothetical protein
MVLGINGMPLSMEPVTPFARAAASCQSQKKENDIKSELELESTKLVQIFFQNIKDLKPEKAMNDLLSSNDNIRNDSSVLSLKNRFQELNQVSGDFISYRLLRKKKLFDDLGVYSYLAKYDKKAYRFLFTFYNNGKAVKLYKISFDDTLDLELEEALRLYLDQGKDAEN